MKKIIIACGVALAAIGISSCGSSNANPSDLKTYEDSLSYYMGASQGQYFTGAISTIPEPEASKFDKESFLRGLKTVLDADTSEVGYLYGLSVGLSMSGQLKNMDAAGVGVKRDLIYAAFASAFKADSVAEAEKDSTSRTFNALFQRAQEKIMEFQQAQQRAAMEEMQRKADANIKAGKEFVDKAIAADKDIKVTESGLAYKVVKQGEGAVVTDTDRVNVIYTGKLIDGTEFDSSKGEARTFSPNGVIRGFAEGLKMMNKGAKYILYIPSELGYGLQGTPNIEPGSTLIFEVEVADIVPAKK